MLARIVDLTDDAVVKLLWLAIRNIEDKRARARAKETGLPANERRAPAKLVEGATVQGWKAALGALAQTYPDLPRPTQTGSNATSSDHSSINLHRQLDMLTFDAATAIQQPWPLTDRHGGGDAPAPQRARG